MLLPRRVLPFLLLTIFTAATANAQTLRVGLAEDPDVLDPTLARTFVGRIVFAAMCDKLFDIDEKLAIVPQLATGYEWSADNKALTIKLRTDVTFHDGEKLDAAAVKFNLERHKTMAGSNRSGELRPVASVDVVDPATVRLNLSAPFTPILAALADRAGMMVSPKAAKAEGANFGAQPVCCRPVQVRRARRPGPDLLRALSELLEQGQCPLRQDRLHADRRRDGAPGEPALGPVRRHRAGRAVGHRRTQGATRT